VRKDLNANLRMDRNWKICQILPVDGIKDDPLTPAVSFPSSAAIKCHAYIQLIIPTPHLVSRIIRARLVQYM